MNQANLTYMPPLAGDEGDVTQGDPTTWFSLTETQYVKFSLWKDGNFVNDWPGAPPEPEPVDTLDVGEQPAALDPSGARGVSGRTRSFPASKSRRFFATRRSTRRRSG